MSFLGLVLGRVSIDWESKDTGVISIGSQLMNIAIESINFLGANSLFENKSDYDESDYDESDFDESDYGEPDYN